MKYLKTYQSYITESFAGRDNGYPETKTVIYDNLKDLSKNYGKKESEKYYRITEIDATILESEINKTLKLEKIEETNAKKVSIKNEIEWLQKQLEELS